MILLWGISGDGPLSMVRQALEHDGAKVFMAEQRTLHDSEIDFSVTDTIDGVLRIGAEWVDLAAIRAAYVRPYDRRRLQVHDRADGQSASSYRAARIDDALLCWTEVSRPL